MRGTSLCQFKTDRCCYFMLLKCMTGRKQLDENGTACSCVSDHVGRRCVCSSSPGCWFLTWELPLSAESHLGCHGNGSGTGWQCVCVRCIMKGRRDMGPHLNAWLNLYNSSLCSLQLCWSQAPGILQPQWMCASQHFFILLTLLRVDTDTKCII